MLAIAGGKGGCGKTTTTLALGRALARDGRTPLLVDADVAMPDLHLGADVAPDPGLPALVAGREPTAIARSVPAEPGLAVVPAGGADPGDLPQALAVARAWDGPVLVDCPAGAGRDATAPLRAADRTLLVTAPTAPSLRDAVKTEAMARELDADPIGVLLIEATPPIGEPADTATVGQPTSTIAGAFTCQVIDRIPHAPGGASDAEAVRTAYWSVAKKLQERNI